MKWSHQLDAAGLTKSGKKFTCVWKKVGIGARNHSLSTKAMHVGRCDGLTALIENLASASGAMFSLTHHSLTTCAPRGQAGFQTVKGSIKVLIYL